MILMEVIIMNISHTVCQIEHHAMMFAFLSKHAIRLCGNRGKDAILDAMTREILAYRLSPSLEVAFVLDTGIR